MPTIVSPNTGIDEAWLHFKPCYDKKRRQDSSLPPNLSLEELEKGIVQYENLQRFRDEGIYIKEHIYENPSKLSLQRKARIGSTLAAVVLNIGSSIGLFYSGAKLLLASIFGQGDIDDGYSSTNKSFITASLAGLGNALSHENVHWGGGALGMGLFSKYLDKPWGLALFSIFDGLNALGMGEVNRRDKKNAPSTPSSIFDNPRLKTFKFLMPYEGAIKSFVGRFSTKQGWKKTLSDEPYEIFQSAGGGLISGGLLLGAASVFSNKMSDAVKSLFYIPYSITSLVNLIALGRDGLTVKNRAALIYGREPAETKMMKTEGWSKAIAAPVLAVNYGLLALKGLGLGLNGGIEHIAMGFRCWGVGIANLGFAAQSAVRFFIPDLFGPKAKEVIQVLLQPHLVIENFLKLIRKVDDMKDKDQHESNVFEPIINSDKYHELLNRISATKQFQNLKLKSQTGLPSEMALERSMLNRYVHSRRVGAIGIMYFDALLRNTTDPILKEYLLENEAAFKVACLTHDNGHFMRSHTAETATCGLDNDEESIKGLNEGTDIYNEVVKYYTEIYGAKDGLEKAKAVLTKAQEIIGHKDEALRWKYADFTEYACSNGGDFNSSLGFTSWNKTDYEYFADQMRLHRYNSEKKEKVKMCFTEEGAIIAFKLLYYRLLFNAFLNHHPITQAKELAYKLGIQHANLTVKEVIDMQNEAELDSKAYDGAQKITGTKQFTNRTLFGGKKAYCGYGQPKDLIYIDSEDQNGNITRVTEFLDYFETDLKRRNPEMYISLLPMVKILTTPTQIELQVEVLPKDSKEFTNIARREEEPAFSGTKTVLAT